MLSVEPRFHRLYLWRDGLHLCRAGQRGEQNLAIFGGFCDGALLKFAKPSTLAAGRSTCKLMAGALQVGGHRPAHRAQADEADPHMLRSSNTSLAISAALPARGQPT